MGGDPYSVDAKDIQEAVVDRKMYINSKGRKAKGSIPTELRPEGGRGRGKGPAVLPYHVKLREDTASSTV